MSSGSKPKTILLLGLSLIAKEDTATAAIVPGMLLERTSTGVRPHSTAGGAASPIFAREEEFSGAGIDDAYETDDRVPFYVGSAGCEFYAFIPAGANIAKGALLESNGDGTLRAYTAQAVNEGGTATYTIHDRRVVARALEAVDNSVGAARVRIKVEVV